MRKNYPLISAEINDIFQELYYNLTFILGYDDPTGATLYEGKFDVIEKSLRESIHKVMHQLNSSGNALVINRNTDNEIPLYTTWGRYIIINNLRSM